MSAVLRASDLLRIKQQCATANTSQLSNKQKELREKSRARAAKWGNTLEASRRKKHEIREQELAEREAALDKIDREETEFRESERRKILERAENILFQQNERVKAMNVVLHQADIIDEWKEQERIKEIVRNTRKLQDRRFHEMKQEWNRKYDEREHAKQLKSFQNRKMVAKVQQEQLEEIHARRRKEEELVKEENQKMIEHIEKMKLEAEEQDRAREQYVKDMKVQMVKDLEEQKRLKRLAEAEEQKLEDKIKIYAQNKERLVKERKRIAEEQERKKRAIRQKMIDDQVAYLAELKSAEDSRVEKAVAEMKAKEENIERLKREKREKLLQECEELNAYRLRRKEEARRLDKEENKRLKEMAEADAAEYERKEREKFANARLQAVETRKFQKNQILHKHECDFDYEKEMAAYAKSKLQETEDLKAKVTAYMDHCASTCMSEGSKRLIMDHIVKHQ